MVTAGWNALISKGDKMTLRNVKGLIIILKVVRDWFGYTFSLLLCADDVHGVSANSFLVSQPCRPSGLI